MIVSGEPLTIKVLAASIAVPIFSDTIDCISASASLPLHAMRTRRNSTTFCASKASIIVDRKGLYIGHFAPQGCGKADTYPDLFAAIGVHSGLPHDAAKDMPSAFAAMNGAGTAQSRASHASVPTIVLHGDADRTVNPVNGDRVNGDRVIAQAMSEVTSRKLVTHGETPSGMTYTRTTQSDGSDREVSEQWVLHGAGHAWSGGSSNGSYTDPRGPDASREMVRFFLSHTKGGGSFRH